MDWIKYALYDFTDWLDRVWPHASHVRAERMADKVVSSFRDQEDAMKYIMATPRLRARYERGMPLGERSVWSMARQWRKFKIRQMHQRDRARAPHVYKWIDDADL